ncbi:MAG: hypothetical protein LRZ88_13100 [Candidatus Cloacimonetes bacterium]|nr:hypothetical protein [Candidatus Cloacimonadota bacterium]
MLSLESYHFDDSQGDNDGNINPGELIRFLSRGPQCGRLGYSAKRIHPHRSISLWRGSDGAMPDGEQYFAG